MDKFATFSSNGATFYGLVTDQGMIMPETFGPDVFQRIAFESGSMVQLAAMGGAIRKTIRIHADECAMQ